MKKIIILIIVFLSNTIYSQDYYTYKANVIRVYDGDTVWCDIDLGFNIVLKNIKIRLYGINTPEVKTKNTLEKEAGIKVRNYVRELILNKEVTLKTFKNKNSKYGEYLGLIFIRDLNLNKNLITRNFCHEYYGDRKNDFSKKELNHIIQKLN